MNRLTPAAACYQPFDAGVCLFAQRAQIGDVGLRFSTQPFAYRTFRPLDRLCDRVGTAVRVDDLAQAHGEAARGLSFAPVGHRGIPECWPEATAQM